MFDHHNWKTRDNQRNVNGVTILYKMILSRVVINLTFILSHNCLPTQLMDGMFPDMTPHGMSLYDRVASKQIIK